LPDVLDILSSVMLLISKIVVVDAEAEEAPLQGRTEECRMQGKNGACMDASWGAKQEKYASSIMGPQAHPRALGDSLSTKRQDPLRRGAVPRPHIGDPE
jgi:hypothetical protein